MHPRVLLEAMSQRLPVVTSSVGSIPLFVQHERNGLLVEPGNPEAIARAAERLMEDASLYRRVVVEGVRFVSDHTIERDTERMMALVEEHFGRSFKKRDPHREGS
jgi:glycosyltransferase involved in cell wall biosynthesis